MAPAVPQAEETPAVAEPAVEEAPAEPVKETCVFCRLEVAFTE